MSKYKNLSGDSPIISYEIDLSSITIKFKGNYSYKYTYQSSGRQNIEKMKKLALSGKGLSSFISRNIKEKYSSKFR